MREHTGAAPPGLDPPPVEDDGLWFIAAFHRLAGARQGGMGPCPISLESMDTYLGLDPPPDWIATVDVIDLLQAMDHEYLAHAKEARANEK